MIRIALILAAGTILQTLAFCWFIFACLLTCVPSAALAVLARISPNLNAPAARRTLHDVPRWPAKLVDELMSRVHIPQHQDEEPAHQTADPDQAQ